MNAHILDRDLTAGSAMRAIASIHVAPQGSTSNAFDAEHADRTRERPTHQHKHKTHTHTLHAHHTHHTHHTHHSKHEHDTTPTSVETERNAPRY